MTLFTQRAPGAMAGAVTAVGARMLLACVLLHTALPTHAAAPRSSIINHVQVHTSGACRAPQPFSPDLVLANESRADADTRAAVIALRRQWLSPTELDLLSSVAAALHVTTDDMLAGGPDCIYDRPQLADDGEVEEDAPQHMTWRRRAAEMVMSSLPEAEMRSYTLSPRDAWVATAQPDTLTHEDVIEGSATYWQHMKAQGHAVRAGGALNRSSARKGWTSREGFSSRLLIGRDLGQRELYPDMDSVGGYWNCYGVGWWMWSGTRCDYIQKPVRLFQSMRTQCSYDQWRDYWYGFINIPRIGRARLADVCPSLWNNAVSCLTTGCAWGSFRESLQVAAEWGNPQCKQCGTFAATFDAYGTQYGATVIAATTFAPMTCQAGSWTGEAGPRSALCRPCGGWDYSNVNSFCRVCNPPVIVGAVAPYPAFGSIDFAYTCAPGFTAAGGSRALTCPTYSNSGNQFVNPPLNCQCADWADGSHTCSRSRGAFDEAWVTGPSVKTDPADRNGTWVFRGPVMSFNYRVAPGVAWPTASTDPNARGTVLVGVRVTVQGVMEGCSYSYTFSPAPDVMQLRNGMMRLTNEAQPKTLCVVPAEAYIHFRNSAGLPVPIIAPMNSSDSITLEAWRNSYSAMQRSFRSASGYFAIPGDFSDTFSLGVRIQAAGSTGMGIRDVLRGIEANTVAAWARGAGLMSFHTDRATIGVEFSFLPKKCDAGFYQDGDTCLQCPAATYNARSFTALTYINSAKTLLPNVTGVANSLSPCWNCALDTCQYCLPQDGLARTLSTFCYIPGLACVPAYTMKPVAKCQWCDPALGQGGWSPQPRGTGCDDEIQCTFNDQCNQGECSGVKDDCLRSTSDPTMSCEACGSNACVKTSSYAGCVYAFDWAATVAARMLSNASYQFSNADIRSGSVAAWYSPGAIFMRRNASSAAVNIKSADLDAILLQAASLAPGLAAQPLNYVWGMKRSCGCSIDGKCFPNGAVNPENVCQRCDVTLNVSSWSAVPAGKLCNDGDACTYADQCVAGQCVGTFLNCSITDAMPCVAASVCRGTDTCAVTYRPTSYKCFASPGPCIADSFCDGSVASCPTAFMKLPRVSLGALELRAEPPLRDALTAALSFPPFGADTLLGYPVNASGPALSLGTPRSLASCGGVAYRLGIYPDPLGTADCTPTAVTSVSGYGWSDWQQAPGAQLAWISNASVFNMTVRANDTSASRLQHGRIVRARLEARSDDGTIAFGCVRFVTAFAPPAAGAVWNLDPAADTVNASLTSVRFISLTQVRFTWRGFADSYSNTWGGLLRYSYAVGTAPGLADVIPWRNVALGVGSGATDPFADALPVYIPLFVTVRGYNRAGLFSMFTAPSVFIDTTGPVNGSVFDGLAVNSTTGSPIQTSFISIAEVLTNTPLRVQWTGFTDPQTSVDRYEVAFGTRAGGTDISLGFMEVPGGASARNFSFPFSAWLPGYRYIATVRAVSISGAVTTMSTPGMWFDGTPPRSVQLRSDFSFLACASTVLRYTYIEAESIVVGANVSVRSGANSVLLANTTINATTVASRFVLPYSSSYVDGITATVSVRLINVVALASSTASLTAVMDCSPPVAPAAMVADVRPGTASGAVRFHTGPYLSASWAPFTDSTSGILFYEISITSTGVAADVVAPDLAGFKFAAADGGVAATVITLRNVSQSTFFNVSMAELVPVPGWTYYTHVRATNGAGLQTTLVSSGVVIDPTPPVISAVVVGASVTARIVNFTANSSSLTITWSAFDAESGVAAISVAVGTLTSITGVLSWTPVAWNASQVSVSVSLVQNTTYTVSVRVTNNVGLVSTATSRPVTVDITPPVTNAAALKDGLAVAQISYSADISRVTANWAGLCSDGESGLLPTSVCAGSTAGACDLMNTTLLPASQTSVTFAINTAALSTVGAVCPVDRSSASRLLVEAAPQPRHTWTEAIVADAVGFSSMPNRHAPRRLQSSPRIVWSSDSAWVRTVNGGNGLLVETVNGLRRVTTSYAYGEEQQVINVTSAATGTEFTVFESAQGYSRDGVVAQCADTYRIYGGFRTVDSLAMCPSANACFDSGTVTMDCSTRNFTYTLTKPAGAATLRISHGGQDKEFWAGNFGSRFFAFTVTTELYPSASALPTPSPTPSGSSSGSVSPSATASATSSTSSSVTATPTPAAAAYGPAWLQDDAVRTRCVSAAVTPPQSLRASLGSSATLSVCLFATITLFGNGQTVVLGRFRSWAVQDIVSGVATLTSLQYNSGERTCGVERSANVALTCSSTSNSSLVGSVAELQGCGLNMTVAIPEACNNLMRARVAPAPVPAVAPAWTLSPAFRGRCGSGSFIVPSSFGALGNFTVCPYANVTMSVLMPGRGPVQQLLGYFDSWITSTSSDFSMFRYMYFSGGENACGAGTRAVFVDFTCGSAPSVSLQPTEIPTCVNYFITLSIPEACGANFAVPYSAAPPSASMTMQISASSSRSAFPSSSSGAGAVTTSASPLPLQLRSAPWPSPSTARTEPGPLYGPASLSGLRGACITFSIAGASLGAATTLLNVTSEVGVTPWASGTNVAFQSVSICPFANVSVSGYSNTSSVFIPPATTISAGVWDSWTTLTLGGVTTYDRWFFRSGAACNISTDSNSSASTAAQPDGRMATYVSLFCAADGVSRLLSVSQFNCMLRLSVALPAMCDFANCPAAPTSQQYTTVTCMNGAGLTTAPITSPGVVKDAFPPVIGAVMYGTGACAGIPSVNRSVLTATPVSGMVSTGLPVPMQPYYFAPPAVLTISVCGFYTVAAPLRIFNVTVGTQLGAADVLPAFGASTTLITLPQVALIDGVAYFATVSAISTTGLSALVSAAAPAVYDGSPPAIASVQLLLSGTGNASTVSLPIWPAASYLRVCAVGVLERHTPIVDARVMFGLTAGASQYTASSNTPSLTPIIPTDFARLGLVMNATSVCTVISDLALAPGLQHTLTLTLTNAAGLTGIASTTFTPAGAAPDAFAAWTGEATVPTSRLASSAGIVIPASTVNASVNLPFFFTLSRDIALGVSGYFVAAGSAPGRTDVTTWAQLPAATWARTIPIMTPAGVASAVAPANLSLPALPAADTRIWISVLACNALGLSSFLAGITTACTMATAARPFVWDRSPPLFQTLAAPFAPAPVVVASGLISSSGAAALPPSSTALWRTSFGAGGIVNGSAITVLWVPALDLESGVVAVDVAIFRVAAVSAPNNITSSIMNWTRIANPASTAVQLLLPSTPLTPFTSNSCSIVRSGVDIVGGAFVPGYTSAALNVSSISICCGLCTSLPQCVAYVYARSAQSCWLYAAIGAIMPSASDRAVGVLSDARAAFVVQVRATNGVGLSSIASSLPLVVDSTPPLPPTAVAVLSSVGCASDGTNLTALHQSSLGVRGGGASGLASMCIAFSPGSDAQTSVVQYAIAVGNRPGQTQVVPLTPITPNSVRTVSSPSGGAVYRFTTPAFQTQHMVALYTTLRAYDAAGNYADTTVGPTTIVSLAPTTVGFRVWASSTRTTVRYLPSSARSIQMSWTGPGGDAAQATWFRSISAALPTPSGLSNFQVALSYAPNASQLVPGAEWQNVGRAQAAAITSGRALDTCANRVDGMSAVDTSVNVRTPSYPAGIVGATLASCCAACSSDAACVAYVFASDGTSPNCVLLATVRTIATAANRTFGYVGGPLSALNLTSMCPAMSSRVGVAPQSFIASALYPMGLNTSNADACCAACASDATCVAYVTIASAVNGTSCFPLSSVTTLLPNENATVAFLQLATMQPVYALVAAVSNVGLSTTVSTVPLTFQLAPPLAGVVIFPAWVGGSSSVPCSWAAFWDPDSIVTYTVGLVGNTSAAPLSTVPAAQLNMSITGAINVGMRQSINFTVPASSLAASRAVVCVVRACNDAGMCTSVASPPASVDVMPASFGSVTILTTPGSNATQPPQRLVAAPLASGSTLYLSWTPCMCGASGVASYSVCADTTPTGCSALTATQIAANATSWNGSLQGAIFGGNTLFARVRCLCGSGASADTAVARTIVDVTAPSLSNVAAGASVRNVGVYMATAATVTSIATSICPAGGIVSEFGIAILQCPINQYITDVAFASYGRPMGNCGNYSINGTCHFPLSAARLFSMCIGRNRCTFSVNNTLFGEPCVGLAKSVAAQVTCEFNRTWAAQATPSVSPTPSVSSSVSPSQTASTSITASSTVSPTGTRSVTSSATASGSASSSPTRSAPPVGSRSVSPSTSASGTVSPTRSFNASSSSTPSLSGSAVANAPLPQTPIPSSTPTPAVPSSPVYIQSPTSPLFCSWTAAADPESGALGISYTAGFSYSPSGTPLLGAIFVSSNTSATFDPQSGITVPFSEGIVYCVVVATNAAGLSTTSVSPIGIAADWSAPIVSAGVVLDGTIPGVDAAISAEACNALSFSWGGIYDAGTGIQDFEGCITTNQTSALCDITPWTLMSGSDRHTFTALQLTNVSRYYACVRAWDYTNRVSAAVCSDGIIVDCTPPTVAAAVMADAAWELRLQASDNASSGWAYAHLFAPITVSTLVSAVLPPLPISDPRVLAYFNGSLPVTTADSLGGVFAANFSSSSDAAASSFFLAPPRLTVGVPFTSAAAARGSKSCVLSTRAFETPLLTVSMGQASGASICVAGTYREPSLGICVPCADGTFKPNASDAACGQCGSTTLAAARAAADVITDVSQQQRVATRPGPTSCDCWHATQVFDDAVNACICRPGYIRNASVPLLRTYIADAVARAALPPPCVLIDNSDGISYKPFAGDSSDGIKACPAGTSPSALRDSCLCDRPEQTYDPVSRKCLCPARTYLANVTLQTGPVTMCIACRPGTQKLTPGNDAGLCQPCPWGTIANSTGPGCVPDVDILSGSGAMLMPDGSALACAPGNELSGGLIYAPGILIDVMDSNATVIAASVCMPALPSMATGPGASLQSGGYALVPGVRVAITLAYSNASGLPYAPLLNKPAVADVLPPQSAAITVVPGQCWQDVRSIRLQCNPCADSITFQPSFLPLSGEQAVMATLLTYDMKSVNPTGKCAACPALQSGSVFASTSSALYANWTGVFSDGPTGSGIAEYQYAVGTVMGGSQVVPYTKVPSNVTAVAIAAGSVAVPRGTPMFLSVEAIDAAGNRALLMDTRPVFFDNTAPMVGLVIDASLDAIFGADGVYAAAVSTSARIVSPIVTGRDVAAGNINTAGVSAAVARIAAITDAYGAGNMTGAAALLALPVSAFAAGNKSVNDTALFSWRNDPTFTSLAGVPDATGQTDATTYSMAWEPVQDTGSGIAALGYCLGSTPYACDVVPMAIGDKASLTVSSITFDNISLPPGKPVYGAVFAVNGVGLLTVSISNGVVADDRAPSVGIVYDVGGYFEQPLARSAGAVVGQPVPTDIDCDVAGAGIGAVWEDFVAPAGLDHYEFGVGSAPHPATMDVLAFTPVGVAASVYNASLNPAEGALVFACVKAVSNNGASAVGCSDGVRIMSATVDADGADSVDGGPAAFADGMFSCFSAGIVVDGSTLTAGNRSMNSSSISSVPTVGRGGIVGWSAILSQTENAPTAAPSSSASPQPSRSPTATSSASPSSSSSGTVTRSVTPSSSISAAATNSVTRTPSISV